MHKIYKIKIIATFILILFSSTGFSQSNAFKVTLDAGHGAHDFGAVYEGRIEKNIALAIVLKVGKLLEATPLMVVNYTRKTDVFIDLIERANIANRFNANIFVSIHCNANRNTAADGTERGEGVKQAPFMVLHKAYMPRVLIETGFISNTIEGNLLNSEEGQNEIAKAIAEAIISYKKEYYGNGEVEVVGELPSQKINEKPTQEIVIPIKSRTTSQTEEQIQIKRTVDNSTAVFKVQFLASIRKLELIPRNFKGLKNVTVVYDSNVYKYMYEETSDYEKAKQNLQEVKGKGFDSAFLIAFKNGEKVNIQDALK